MLLCGALSVLGGWMLDKYGPRKVAFVMGIFTGLSLLLSSQVNAFWQLYITYSLLMAVGTGAIFPVVNSTTSRWFKKRRGLAVGITSSAGALGEVFSAPVSTILLISFDWRMSFIILGFAALIFLLPLTLVMKKDPGDIGLLPDGVRPETNLDGLPNIKTKVGEEGLTLSQAIRVREFWFLTFIWLLLSLSVHMIMTHSVPHAIDLGISPINAAFIVSLIGIGGVIGRIVTGRLSDTIGRKKPAMIGSIVQIISLISLIFIHDLWMFYFFAFFFGYSWGELGSQVTVLISDIFGVRNVGAIMGTITAGWALGAAIGPAAAGLAFDFTGQYTVSFVFAAVGMIISTILVIMLRTGKAYGLKQEEK